MGKSSVKLKYRDMIAIKHALLASVYHKKKMIEAYENTEAAARIPQLKKDVKHEESLAKYMATEAKIFIGGELNTHNFAITHNKINHRAFS